MKFGHFEHDLSPDELHRNAVVSSREDHRSVHERAIGARPRASTGVWPGATRREENHLFWEEHDTRGAIKAKGMMAWALAITRRGRRKQVRHQRNNRREY